jgi:hypothetical protein
MAHGQAAQPRDCEQWQTTVEQQRQSDDPLAQQLAGYFDEPGERYCRQMEMPVQSDSDWDLDFDLPDWGANIATVLRVITIAGLVALGIWLLVVIARRLPGRLPPLQTPVPAKKPSRRALDEDLSLPSNIPEHARKAWQAGQPRRAVSLLYRGAVEALLGEGNANSLTESEVLRALRQARATQPQYDFMRTLSRCWLSLAWRHTTPSQQQFEQLLEQWPHHCAGGSE